MAIPTHRKARGCRGWWTEPSLSQLQASPPLKASTRTGTYHQGSSPSLALFSLLLSGRRCRCPRTHPTRFRKSYFPHQVVESICTTLNHTSAKEHYVPLLVLHSDLFSECVFALCLVYFPIFFLFTIKMLNIHVTINYKAKTSKLHMVFKLLYSDKDFH